MKGTAYLSEYCYRFLEDLIQAPKKLHVGGLALLFIRQP